ncbi:Hsp20 family protein [Arthrobacter yangruifuii]|uniref:Hsp20 family protein n=1 Tax=Arthrobacter yangruifuii TaxID=2606616 RepID=A0A5N6MG18_9MICC|nr:Hsp20/alpha crystallin family protein [Arthrobacter yangruifuii]KAD3515140.1 Hsp20 family protein [Arthrobacter yangruifuii]
MAMKFDPFRELDRVAGALLDPRQRLRLMPIDLYREGDHYILNADLPGIDPGSVDVDVDGQLLTIRAERTIQTSEGATWLTRERESGSFLRQLNLGQGIDIESISAKYENGVLSVFIPVSERSKPRKIEVAAAYKDDHTISGQSTSEPASVSSSGSGGSSGSASPGSSGPSSSGDKGAGI